MVFVSDVSRVFVVAVSHGLGPNLAAVRGFRRRDSKARFRDDFEASFVPYRPDKSIWCVLDNSEKN